MMVSVVIPTYNRASLIGRAVKSALDQTYQDIEIIVIDDGSDDNTEEIINKFRDERLTFIKQKCNQGPASARNAGIRLSKGQYIAFLDSDDVWHPEKLEKHVRILKTASPEVGVSYSGSWRVMRGKRYYIPDPAIPQKEGNIFNNILCGKYLVPTPAAVVKKICLEKVGLFDESFEALEEWDLWIRISKRYCFQYLDEALVTSYFTPGSISSDRRNFITAIKLIKKKHFKEFKKNRKALMFFAYKFVRLSVGNILHKLKVIK